MPVVKNFGDATMGHTRRGREGRKVRSFNNFQQLIDASRKN